MTTRANQRKFHFIYKITRNDDSGRFYIGLHSTDNLNDGYFGSGQVLWKSIKKHGKENHTMEILEFLETRDDLKIREREIVNEELLKDPKCMNLVKGGGGVDYHTEASKLKMSDASSAYVWTEEAKAKLKKSPDQREAISQRRKGKATFVTEEQRKNHSKKISGSGNGMFGVERPANWCEDQSKRQSDRYASGTHHFIGQPSAVKGRKWYHNPVTGENRMLISALPGWEPGRFK